MRGIFFLEITNRPRTRKKNDPKSGGILGHHAAAGQEQIGALGQRGAINMRPAGELPRGGLHPAIRAVFGLESVLHDFELQGADGAEERHALDRVGKLELLRDAFFEELVEAFAEAFEFRGARIPQVSETLGREAWRFFIANRGILAHGVTDQEIVIPHDADHIAGPGFIHGLAFLREEALGIS